MLLQKCTQLSVEQIKQVSLCYLRKNAVYAVVTQCKYCRCNNCKCRDSFSLSL